MSNSIFAQNGGNKSLWSPKSKPLIFSLNLFRGYFLKLHLIKGIKNWAKVTYLNFISKIAIMQSLFWVKS